MKKASFVWGGVVILIIAVIAAVNYKTQSRKVSLTDIFPEEESAPVDVEYEFVNAQQGNQVKVGESEEMIELADLQPQSQVSQPLQQPSVSGGNSVSQQISPAQGQPSQVSSGVAKFTIQVASTNSDGKAQSELKRVAKKFPDAYVAQKDLGAKGIWYRIYIGNFGSKQEAEQKLQEVKQVYKDSFIISVK